MNRVAPLSCCRKDDDEWFLSGNQTANNTESYSDSRGIPVFSRHRYSLTTVYNNTSGHDVDAMAALWMYFRSPEAPGPALASK